jgi:Rho GTPase-activating protein RGD1
MLPSQPLPEDVKSALMSWEYSDNPSPVSTAHSLQPRNSFESRKWKDSSSLTDSTFDESVLRALCDLDCGVPLLLERIKQGMISCREASFYFRKRAVLEEDYGKSLLKLARTTSDVYSNGEGKAGTFVTAWQRSLKIQETLADNRLGFAQKLSEMSEELKNLANETDKSRKQVY